jgi:carboxymethylenebutenolidase
VGNMNVIEREIEIHAPDGTADGYLYCAEDGRRLPGVIHLTDIGGVRPSHRGMARRLAEQGYSVLLPNVFYRNAHPPVFVIPPGSPEDAWRKRFAELTAPLTPEVMERDASAYVDFLAAQDCAAMGPMGVVGHCFTGSMAMRAAAARPDKIVAAASFHGGGLYTAAPTSPHLVLPRVKAQLYFGHAFQDRSMPEEAIQNLNGALAAWGGRYESETYTGAHHGWTVPDGQAYNQPQADRAFEKLTQLFAQTLK